MNSIEKSVEIIRKEIENINKQLQSGLKNYLEIDRMIQQKQATFNHYKSVTSVGKKIESGELNIDVLVSTLNFSNRTNNCLRSANIFTLRDLINLSPADIMKWHNCGKATLNEIDIFLINNDLSFLGL